MEYVKIQLTDCWYIPFKCSKSDMGTLGSFFTSEAGCSDLYWNNWILDTYDDPSKTSGNSIFLERDGEYIYMGDIYDGRPKSKRTKLKISRTSLVKLLHEWREKVCKTKPKYVVITEEDDVFTMQTYDTEDTSGLE
jgi:hypothetical protein